jgi:hypothetical protein
MLEGGCRLRVTFVVQAIAVAALASSAVAGEKQESGMRFYERFFSLLMNNSPELARYHEPQELELSRRLGLEYEGEQNKFMIGYGFEESARRLFREEGLRYTLSAESLDASHIQLTAEVPELNLKKRFVFEEDKLISPVNYYARSWPRLWGKYFEFWVSDTTMFHRAAIEELDRFVDRMAHLLEFRPEDLSLLHEKKIIYIFCKDEEEIERLTGFRSRGMYLLPYDYVVTTYPCHFHEVLHLLVNFKLKKLPLYTHPLLQEGIATAFGGRGGIAASTLLQGGAFLVSSSVVDVKDLLVVEQYRNTDPSIAYPVSALYVRFLIDRMGMNRFLRLYRRYSGSAEQVGRMMLHLNDLPPESQWLAYVKTAEPARMIVLDRPEGAPRRIIAHGDIEIAESGEWFRIRMSRNFGLRPAGWRGNYISPLYRKLVPEGSYNGERFFFVADSAEVVVYDLYTNNSLASYSAHFTPSAQTVPHSSGRYEFWVRKNVFSVPVNEMEVVSDFEIQQRERGKSGGNR